MKTPKRIQLSILGSIVLHVLILILLITFQSKKNAPPENYEITLIEPAHKTPDSMRQLVEQNKSVNEEVPDKSSYLSEKNQKVEKETKAALTGQFSNTAGGKPLPKPVVTPNKQAAGGKPKKSLAKTRVANFKDGLPTLDQLKPQFDWNRVGESSPSFAPQASKDGPSQTNDYLKQTQTGIQTIVNTREFIYYSYYNRIKKQLSQYWEPKIKEKVTKMFRQGREISSEHDRITKLLIVLDDKGTLKAVKVVEDSGVFDLDEAAVEAFKEAAPFPNPPKGIIEQDGTIKIRWDFVLEA